MTYSVGHRCGLDAMLLWLWCRPAGAAQIQPLAWEPRYAVGAALKKKKRERESFLSLILVSFILWDLCFLDNLPFLFLLRLPKLYFLLSAGLHLDQEGSSGSKDAKAKAPTSRRFCPSLPSRGRSKGRTFVENGWRQKEENQDGGDVLPSERLI